MIEVNIAVFNPVLIAGHFPVTQPPANQRGKICKFPVGQGGVVEPRPFSFTTPVTHCHHTEPVCNC